MKSGDAGETDEALGKERLRAAKLERRLAQLEAQSDAAQAGGRHSDFAPRLTLPEACQAEAEQVSASARLAVLNRRAELAGLGETPPAGTAMQGGRLVGAGPAPSLIVKRPLRVAVVRWATTGVCTFTDPRLLVRPLGDPLVAEPDVLMFGRAETPAFIADAGQVPDEIWTRIGRGETSLVLDASREGHRHGPKTSMAIHRFLESHRVKPRLALYLTQDRRFGEDYEAWCAEHRLQPMRTWLFDAFVHKVVSPFEVFGANVFEQRLVEFLTRSPTRPRRFVNLNYTLRATKVMFLLRLMRDGLWDQGWISMGGFSSDTREGIARRVRDLEGFQDEARELLPLMDRLALEPLVFSPERPKAKQTQRTEAVKAVDLPQYRDSWFTVVTETEMQDQIHRITEKPLKPLLAFHPVLMLGSPGALALIRGYGFETFSPVIDERYDDESDPRRRFDMVYDQVRRLCALDEDELARAFAALREVLIFNACWGLTELPRQFSEVLIPELIQQMRPRRHGG
jgi:hypothetical protein